MARRSSITPWELECMLCDETAEPKALPLSLLEEITNDFSDEQEIGRGGFAVVYKGKLRNRTVAVKRMSDEYMDEKVFHREVECLMMVKHKNVVRFLGYCADRQGSMERYDGKFVMADVNQRFLCFEYLPKGSLDKYITDISHGLRWRDRYQIITGICQGLHYLHQKNIVHLDLKPANILLDETLVPKITDFGISRCFHEIQSQVITTIAGTFGYLAPESFNNTKVTYQHSYRLDIYSLGVVITEMITGEKGYHDVDNVVESWSNMLEESHSEVQLGQVRVCAEIGVECIDSNPAKRPDIEDIINRLNKYIETSVSTSQQAEDVSNELHQDTCNAPGETSSEENVTAVEAEGFPSFPNITENGTAATLAETLQSLNPDIRRCFQYCSIFPRGSKDTGRSPSRTKLTKVQSEKFENLTEQELCLKESLAAYRNAADAASNIQAALRDRTLKLQTKAFQLANPEIQAAAIVAAMRIQYAFRNYNKKKEMRAAARIQNHFRTWKVRRNFTNMRRQAIRIQAAYRGHQVRRQWRKVIWSLGVVEKAILRWRKKRKGLRGIANGMPVQMTVDVEPASTAEEDYFQASRQQAEDRFNRSVVRVQALFRCHRAQHEYRRMRIAHEEAKLEFSEEQKQGPACRS